MLYVDCIAKSNALFRKALPHNAIYDRMAMAHEGGFYFGYAEGYSKKHNIQER